MQPKKTLFMGAPLRCLSFQQVSVHLSGTVQHLSHHPLPQAMFSILHTVVILFVADEISTGLDSSTTFQIVQTIGNFCHLRDATVLMALLQPAPEVRPLFVCMAAWSAVFT